MANRRKSEAHVRLYRHELNSEAYRSLSPDARALLIEFRALYTGRGNRVHMSVREMMRRLGAGQRRVLHAREELLDRGFIRMLAKGSFSRKVRHATEYALTNEPLEDKDGATAPKDFMTWQPQKNTVCILNTDGMQGEYRDDAENGKNTLHGMHSEYRQREKPPAVGMHSEYTDRLPGTAGSGTGNKSPDTRREVEHDWL